MQWPQVVITILSGNIYSQKHQKVVIYITTSYFCKDKPTKKREVQALSEAMTELGLDSGIIITRNEEEKIVIENKEIHVMPIWRFLLEWN